MPIGIELQDLRPWMRAAWARLNVHDPRFGEVAGSTRDPIVSKVDAHLSLLYVDSNGDELGRTMDHA